MFEIATLTPNHTVQLLPEIAKQFLPKNRFIVWWEGDTWHLRRLTPSLLQRLADAPEDEAISLDEINDIVHKVRQRRQAGKAE